MRAFALDWPNREIVQTASAQLIWYHNTTLLEKVSTPESRLWYAKKAYEHDWSYPVMVFQIEDELSDDLD